MMLSIALRFIPTLLEETDKIMKAQMSRGADFESGSLIKRAKNLIPVVIPLFISAFRRAEDLALAMESRGYRGGVGRTKLRQLHVTWRDSVLAIITLILFLIIGWW
ncbi:energy-coupling factor transporter transmembrane protein EcfT, partial [Microbacteriaceae bacterium K1510]|nr:energy-coupling factor transporter transmembrane protein EcfT [Microbacteriaceae bacterium K1510]